MPLPAISMLGKNIDGRQTRLLTISNEYGAVVACCELEIHDHVAWLSELFVRQDARRKGLAKHLISTATIIASEEAKVSIGAHVARSNPASLKLFGKLGFVICAEDKEVFYVSRVL